MMTMIIAIISSASFQISAHECTEEINNQLIWVCIVSVVSKNVSLKAIYFNDNCYMECRPIYFFFFFYNI